MSEGSLRALFDTDVLLDVVLRRVPFVDAAAHALLLGEKRLIDAVTTPLVLAALFSTVARIRDIPAAHEAINSLRLILSVLPVGPDETEAAFTVQPRYSHWDAQLQYAAAAHNACQVLVTRNVSVYPTAPVRALTPEEVLGLVPASPWV